MVPLWSRRLQRVALYALNCDQKCLSSSMKALATMRYSFSFFTSFGFFFVFADFLDTNDVD